MGRERKWELPERNESRDDSRKYSRELWEVTSLVEAEVNFLRREKLSRRDYLDYLKNRAKSGDMAVLDLMFRNVSLGKWSKNSSSYRRHEDGVRNPRKKLLKGQKE